MAYKIAVLSKRPIIIKDIYNIILMVKDEKAPLPLNNFQNLKSILTPYES
ncbi:hypothetical protein [Tepidibacter aestuarii]|nr:hypothetical protein [Tepidibacter aestuarii]